MLDFVLFCAKIVHNTLKMRKLERKSCKNFG